MTKTSFPFSHKINAAQVVDKDQRRTVTANAKELEKIAAEYEVKAVNGLEADFVLKPYRKAGLRVTGKIIANLTQTCSVSLDDFDSVLEIEVDRTFEPHSSRPRKIRDLNDDGEIEIDLETLDPPDVITDGVLDLGALICEELALAIDPFPRMPGAEFERGQEFDPDEELEEDERPSAFAALEALKDKPSS